MEPLECLHLQMRLEGNEIVNECLIRQVEVVPGEEVPLMLIAQPVNQALVAYYDEFTQSDLRNELAANIRKLEFPTLDALVQVLKTQNVPFEVGHYKTYVFPSSPGRDVDINCFSKQHPKVKAFGFDGLAEEVYALERDNRIVSACVSTRENEACGEAWVYTAPAYRHQGFAQKVVRAWAGTLMAAGKVPFYSHKIENVASSNLARKLGLQAVFEEIVITQISRDEKTLH